MLLEAIIPNSPPPYFGLGEVRLFIRLSL